MNPPSPEVFFTSIPRRGLEGSVTRTDTVPPRAAWQGVLDPQAGADEPGRRGPPRVSVVFSFWNEEDVLPELIGRLRGVFDILLAQDEVDDYELIFVNDASTDRSEDVLRSEAHRRPDIRVINMSRNFGVSPCVLAGMQQATGDAVIYMDADLQDPPEVIPDLVRAWRRDPEVDVVHTVRRSRHGESGVKRLLTRLGYATLRAVSSIELPNEAGDFKLLSRRAVDQVVQFHEKRPFMRGLVCSIGFKQDMVYYERQPRAAGRTKFPVLGLKVIRNFLDSAVISFSDVPLKIASALGVLLSVVGLCWIAGLLLVWMLGHAVAGWSAVLAGVIYIGGLQLACLGILGSYVGGIYLETKGRPNFIIKNTWGFEECETTASRLCMTGVTWSRFSRPMI